MKELTFGEVAELKEKIEREYPDAELVQIIAAAYKEGYEAAQKER